jgi:hypothetical protein
MAGVTFPEREWTPQQIKHAQRRSGASGDSKSRPKLTVLISLDCQR